MAFDIRVVSHAPLTYQEDPQEVARQFLELIGYSNRKTAGDLAFRVFWDCFLQHPRQGWTAEEVAAATDATHTSVYRHINRLRDLDVIEEDIEERDGARVRIYRLRYGNVSKAWNFAEAHFELAIRNYRQSVDHLARLLEHR